MIVREKLCSLDFMHFLPPFLFLLKVELAVGYFLATDSLVVYKGQLIPSYHPSLMPARPSTWLQVDETARIGTEIYIKEGDIFVKLEKSSVERLNSAPFDEVKEQEDGALVASEETPALESFDIDEPTSNAPLNSRAGRRRKRPNNANVEKDEIDGIFDALEDGIENSGATITNKNIKVLNKEPSLSRRILMALYSSDFMRDLQEVLDTSDFKKAFKLELGHSKNKALSGFLYKGVVCFCEWDIASMSKELFAFPGAVHTAIKIPSGFKESQMRSLLKLAAPRASSILFRAAKTKKNKKYRSVEISENFDQMVDAATKSILEAFSKLQGLLFFFEFFLPVMSM